MADEAGAPRPYRVYISTRVNAAVFYDTSLLNLFVPAKKNLEIGIGLVNVLSLSEFKAAIAHELGHFAQRSMAVGRWAYVAHGIVAQVVRGRDRFDEFILSRDRIRIPVLGPVFRLALWALRAVIESVFIVVLLVERSLSREMELQADRVAVAIAGSESLVHTLHRLEQADRALDEAGVIATFEARAHGVQLPDIFEVQRLVLEELEQALDDHGRRVSGAAVRRRPPRLW
ncbi:MAG: M48 family metallopeptidase [Polyangiaceae bacterium]